MSRGLYLHLPFCVRKCGYCNFVITTDREPEMRARFFNALEREIRQARERYGALTFDTLYWGGGTPSLLTSEEMNALARSLKSVFTFRPGFEWTLEMNPGDADPETIRSFKALGINRVSLGAQSMNDALLKDMGRTHTAAETLQTVKALRSAGIENISLDFIIRLPGQTLADVRRDMQTVLDLNVPHISLYDLEVHEETAYGMRARQNQLHLPAEREHESMRLLAEEILAQGALEPYEILSLGRAGWESKHNLIYWHNEEYLGLGPGAWSFMEGVRYEFAPSVARYLAKCGQDDWNPDQAEKLTGESMEVETLLTGLRLSRGFELSRLRQTRARVESRLAELAQDGLVEMAGGTARLTRRGRFLAETALARLVE